MRPVLGRTIFIYTFCEGSKASGDSFHLTKKATEKPCIYAGVRRWFSMLSVIGSRSLKAAFFKDLISLKTVPIVAKHKVQQQRLENSREEVERQHLYDGAGHGKTDVRIQSPSAHPQHKQADDDFRNGQTQQGRNGEDVDRRSVRKQRYEVENSGKSVEQHHQNHQNRNARTAIGLDPRRGHRRIIHRRIVVAADRALVIGPDAAAAFFT